MVFQVFIEEAGLHLDMKETVDVCTSAICHALARSILLLPNISLLKEVKGEFVL
jgi:hypothetical protein